MTRRFFTVFVAGLGIVGLAVGGAWVWATSRAEHRHAVARGVAPKFELGHTAGPPICRTPLTPSRPLRLWIGGDSLAGSLGPSIGAKFARTGVVEPTFDSRPSSGLASASFFDWPTHATAEMARLHPDIAVIIIGTNDFSFVHSKPVDAQGRPAWRASYRRLVEQMLAVLGEGGRPVIWVGAPTLEERDKDAGVRRLNGLAREVVDRSVDATYVDAYALFSGSGGGYISSLPDGRGNNVRVRTPDGIHFTTKGAGLLATLVFALLDARCDIRAQAVAGHRQPVHETPGSGQLPGAHPDTSGTTTTSTSTSLPTTSTTSSPTSSTERSTSTSTMLSPVTSTG